MSEIISRQTRRFRRLSSQKCEKREIPKGVLSFSQITPMFGLSKGRLGRRLAMTNLGADTIMPKRSSERPPLAPRGIAKNELGRRLQLALDLKGWSQSDLAREAAKHLPGREFHRGNVSVYVGGKSLPRREHLIAMAKALDKTPEDLLPPYLTQTEGGAPQTVQLLDLGNGRCTLIVQKEVPASIALRIWTILQESDNGSH